MKQKAVQLPLDGRGQAYIRSQIDKRGALGRALVDIVSGPGATWTWVPKGTPGERAYRFREGELIEQNRIDRENRTQPMVLVTSSDPILIAYIEERLAKSAPAVCLIRDAMMGAKDRAHEDFDDIVYCGDDALFYITPASTHAAAARAVQAGLSPWGSPGLICEGAGFSLCHGARSTSPISYGG